MNENKRNFTQAIKNILFAVSRVCLDETEVKKIKYLVQDGYTTFAHHLPDKVFINLGMWDKTIYDEYRQLPLDFFKLCDRDDIYTQQLWYYLIRPLIKGRFFNKRLLDIGSGHGIGLKASSMILESDFALGVDLVNILATKANTNFYVKDKVNYIQCDAENLALPNESFDIITNLESSHVYPRVERFYAEVERVLAPGGFFCYADIEIKQEPRRLEAFVKASKKLRIIKKHDITKFVQASIYHRVIVNEEVLYQYLSSMYDLNKKEDLDEVSLWFKVLGLYFLPWWQIRFKNPALGVIATKARKVKPWVPRDHFYYYLIQKEE